MRNASAPRPSTQQQIPRHTPQLCPEKSNSTTSTDSFAAVSNRHFFKLACAAPPSKGLPPITFVFVTFPSAEIVASIFTFPVAFICRASSGYSGSVFVFTFRFALSAALSCALPRGAAASDPPRITAKPSPSSRFLPFMRAPPQSRERSRIGNCNEDAIGEVFLRQVENSPTRPIQLWPASTYGEVRPCCTRCSRCPFVSNARRGPRPRLSLRHNEIAQ